jgi:hypothetical protein
MGRLRRRALAAVVLAAASTAAAPSPAADDAGAAPPSPDAIRWQWDPAADRGGHAYSVTLAGGASVDIVRERNGKITGLRKFGAEGGQLWSVPLPVPAARNAAFLVHGATLYLGLYAESAPGAEIAAVDTASGRLLFRTPLRGLGAARHGKGKYRNRVQLRFVDPWVVAFGDESAGRYIEALDANTGEIVSSRKLHR